MASEPVSSSSSSPSNFGGGTVVVDSDVTAMTMVTPLSHGLLMHCSRLFRLFDELGMKRNAVLLQKLVVLVTVLLIQRVQIIVVVELQLVDHGDAVRHRTHLGADAAADTRLVD